jgi:dihydropteroate synthase
MLAAMLNLEALAELLAAEREAAAARVAEFAVGGRHLAFNSEPAIMGVVNLSADSWYRESVCLTTEMAIRRGRVLAAQGAAIVDVGAESSLAHASRVDDAGQNSRLLPVVKALAGEGIAVSVETYQPAVTRACLEAGAAVLNLTGTDRSDEMFRMVAAHDAAVIICHVQGANVREVGDFDFGVDPTAMLRDYFARQIETATRCGVRVFLNSFRLRTLGFPVCHALPHAFEYFGEEVRCAEPFFAVLAALGKTDLFRTHEVARTRAVLDTLRIY